MSGLLSTEMGDHHWAGKPSRYMTSHPGQLIRPTSNAGAHIHDALASPPYICGLAA